MRRKLSDQDENGSSQSKRPKAEGLERGGPGLDYQVQLLMFFAHQGHTLSKNVKNYTFEIGRERKEAGKFDDIVVRYKLEQDQQWNYLLIQAKHTSETITTGKLLSSSCTAPFTLLKYFSSYIEMKKNYKSDKIESCVIATNTDFEYDTREQLKLKNARAKTGSGKRGTAFYFVDVKQSNDVNQIFKTEEMNETKYYKLDKRPLLLKELEEEFKQSYNELVKKEKQKDTDKEVVKNLNNLMFSGQNFINELQEFLDKLIFIVNLPERKNLRLITKQKIGEELFFLDNSIVDQFDRKMFNYTITLGQDFLGRNEIEEFFLKMKLFIDNLMHRPSYYLKVENSKIDFISKEIPIENFLIQSTQHILIVKTNSTFLSAVKIDKVLKELAVNSEYLQYTYRNKYTFSSFQELLAIENLKKKIIQSFSCKDQSNLCVIIVDSSKDSLCTKEVKDFLNNLYSIASGNSVKKIIFLIEQHRELEWTASMNKEHLKQYIDTGNHFSDLTEGSKRNLLEKYIIFQGQSIKLKCLYFKLEADEDLSLEQLNQLSFDTKSLENLIENTVTVKKPFNFSEFEGSYHMFYEEIDIKNLSENLKNLASEREKIYLITGLPESCEYAISRSAFRDFTNRLSIEKDQTSRHINDLILYIKNNKQIIEAGSDCATMNYFKKVCNNSPNKIVYWIDWKNYKFVLRSLYYPKFLKRNFEYPEKVVILNSFKEELCKCDRNTFIIDGVKTIDELFKILQVQNAEEKKNLIDSYESKKIYIQMEIEEHEIDNLKRSNEPIHWLQVEQYDNIKQIIWRKSYGSLDSLRNYSNIERNTLDEENLINVIRNKSSIIIEKPGMGKSTTLSILSEKMLKSHWVMFVTLKYMQTMIDNLPETIDTNVIIKFLSDTNNVSTDLERNLLQYSLDKKQDSIAKPLLLLFDGFDEIRSYDNVNSGKDKFEKLLKFIRSETSATVWITAREHDTNRLQNALAGFHIQFKPLEKEQQYLYFRENWNTSLAMAVSKNDLDEIFSTGDSKFGRYFNELSKATDKILADKNNDFMGIPLTLRLFAESFRNKFKKYLNPDEADFKKDFDNLSKLNLYKYFIDEKFKIFLNEKTNLSSGFNAVSEKWLKGEITKFHYRLAFTEVFGKELCKKLLGSKTPFQGDNVDIICEELETLLSLGIVRSTGQDHYEFLHRTFAEYFVSELFIYMLLSKPQNNEEKYRKILEFLRLEILKQSNAVIFHFLNVRSQEHEQLKKTWELITSGEGEHGNLLDEATKKNVLIIRQAAIGKSGNNIKSLRDAVESYVKWNADKTSFQYREKTTYVGVLTELLEEFLFEKDCNQLKSTLKLLTKLLGKTVFRIFNRTLTAVKLESLLSLYISRAIEQRTTCDVQFVQDCVDEIFKIGNEDVERELNQKFKCNFREKYFSTPCNIMSRNDFRQFTEECMEIYDSSGSLALEIMNTYIIQLSKNDSTKALVCETQDFLKNIVPLLLSSNYYLCEYKSNSNFEIDAFSIVKVFASMDQEIIEGVELSKAALRGLLKFIRDITHVRNISNKSFIYSIFSLMALRHWNFRLIYDDLKGLVLYHNSTNFSVALELEHEQKIVNLLKLRNRCLLPAFERECAEVVRSILEKS